MITTAIGGRYVRVVDPDWDDALDSSYSMAAGGRWNAAGTYPVLYLNETVGAARANVSRLLRLQADLGLTLDVLDPDAMPALIEVEVPAGIALELTTDEGLRAVGLPVSYPLDESGSPITLGDCQPIGAQAHATGLDGIRARCAARGAATAELELAWFPRGTHFVERTGQPVPFHAWY